jgi:hypothetical protein
MESGPPILEYAPSDPRPADRHHLAFVLAGLPAIVVLFVPVDAGGVIALQLIQLWRWSTLATLLSRPETRMVVAGFAGLTLTLLCPLSLLIWHLLRLRGSEPGRLVARIAFAVALVHALGLATLIVLAAGAAANPLWLEAAVGAVLLCLAILAAVAARRVRFSALVLLLLLCTYVTSSILFSVCLMTDPKPPTAWAVLFPLAAAGGLVEFVHVLRSGFGTFAVRAGPPS